MSMPGVDGRPFLPTQRALPAAWLFGALLLGMAVALQSGAVPMTARDWLSALGLGAQQGVPGAAHVLWSIRLPRAFFSVLVGAGMGMAGALTQGLFRNPLADPGLLGVSAGAACAAALTIVVFSGFNLPIPISWRPWPLPAAAFAGA
ncbi:iron ABC transporter permease, partial [Verminephrobacter sp. Larva24]